MKKRPKLKKKSKTLEQRIHVKHAECSSYQDGLSTTFLITLSANCVFVFYFLLVHCPVVYTDHKCNYI